MSPQANAALERLRVLAKGRVPYLVVRWEQVPFWRTPFSQRSRCDQCGHEVAVSAESLSLAEATARSHNTTVAILCAVCTGMTEPVPGLPS